MAAQCSQCGARLKFWGRMTGDSICPECRQKAEQIKVQAKQDYSIVLRDVWLGKTAQAELSSKLKELAALAGLKYSEERKIAENSFTQFAEEVLQDDKLTQQEEDKLFGIAKLIGITAEDL
ncbi:MAG: hypothetical protein PHG36_11615, partial [Dehalococcoidia bacterium]|nr:hypothetical protein [Dehalococcoidia bacterium]